MYSTPNSSCNSNVIVTRGFVFQPLFCMLLISGSYLACLCVRAYSGNLSWQYVNSMSCMICVGVGFSGIGVWVGTPSTLSIFVLNLTWHWQFVCEHVHLRSHSSTLCVTTWTQLREKWKRNKVSPCEWKFKYS